MRELRGLTYLSWLTFRRQILARKSIVAAVLIVLLTMATAIWTQRNESRSAEQGTDLFERQFAFITNTVVVQLFTSFLMPILVLTYATAALGEEREDRTLVYTLIRPLARWRVYLAKAMGVVPLTLLATLGGYAMVCLAGGEAGRLAWIEYWPAIVRGCLAYTALFLLFGAVLPRPVVLAVLYAFLIEALLGNMPGTIKRMAVSFYTNCMIFEAADLHGVSPRLPQYESISASSAMLVLDLIVIALLIAGALWFQRKEYRDLA
jgi:ABC-2 type transport system permease protein